MSNINLSQQISKQFRDVYFGGNWTDVNMKQTLFDVDWQQATTKVFSFNTIAALVYHTNYYVNVVMKVLQNESLSAHDKYSFNLPPVQSQQDWETLLNQTWNDAERFAALIEQLSESKLWETMADEKYGNYYRNLCGIVNTRIIILDKWF